MCDMGVNKLDLVQLSLMEHITKQLIACLIKMCLPLLLKLIKLFNINVMESLRN